MKIEMDKVDAQIYTRIGEYVRTALPQLTKNNFSRTKENPSSEAELPFIYFKRIDGIEKGMTLECDRFEGGLFTYQITVTSNVSKSEAEKIMNVVTKAFKSLGFHSTSLPLDNEVNNLYVYLARWQRNLAEGDTI